MKEEWEKLKKIVFYKEKYYNTIYDEIKDKILNVLNNTNTISNKNNIDNIILKKSATVKNIFYWFIK